MSTLTTTPTQPRYHARETDDGFILDSGADRPPLRVIQEPTCWRLETTDAQRTFGLYEVQPLVECAACWTMGHWQPRAGSQAPEWRLREWVVRQASRSIAAVVAIRWHRAHVRQQPEDLLAATDSDDPVVLPPIALPNIPGLTFLDMAGGIYRESLAMGHCISILIPEAVAGRSFLFHYQGKNGDSASVEVGDDGRVRQSFGPHNKSNRASRVAARLLRQWARDFPPPPRRAPTPDDGIRF